MPLSSSLLHVEVSISRHEVEQRLRWRERWFSTTLRAIGDAVIAVDLAGEIVFMNPQAEALIGVCSDQAIGRPAREIVRFGGPGQPPSPLDHVLEHGGNLVIDEATLTIPSSAHRIISGTAAMVMDDSDPLGAILVFRDITSRKLMLRQLEVADRLASLGTLTTRAAHQINNPLAVVLSNASYIRGELDEISAALGALGDDQRALGDRLAELAQIQTEISAAGSRIAKIVTDLKGFSRPPEFSAGSANVAHAIDWAIRTTVHELRHRVTLVQDVAALPSAVGDELRLEQVFVNLLMNAAQAIAPGRVHDNQVAIRARAEAGRIIVEVQDTGPGIAQRDLLRIFEPFFTTRPADNAGLGLSVCREILTSMGGEIQVASEVGRGTTFRVILRAAAPVEVAIPPAPPAARLAARRGRILVVDDDTMIHRTLKRLLRGHELISTESARDALAILASGERFDFILSDLMMPIMTGMEFYDEVVARDPELAQRIVFVTGGALTTARAMEFLATVPNITIEKPFGMAEIQTLVTRMLGTVPTMIDDRR